MHLYYCIYLIYYFHFKNLRDLLKEEGLWNSSTDFRDYTEKTVLSNQQKYFVGIYATKFFCCSNKTFCYINKILVT